MYYVYIRVAPLSVLSIKLCLYVNKSETTSKDSHINGYETKEHVDLVWHDQIEQFHSCVRNLEINLLLLLCKNELLPPFLCSGKGVKSRAGLIFYIMIKVQKSRFQEKKIKIMHSSPGQLHEQILKIHFSFDTKLVSAMKVVQQNYMNLFGHSVEPEWLHCIFHSIWCENSLVE